MRISIPSSPHEMISLKSAHVAACIEAMERRTTDLCTPMCAGLKILAVNVDKCSILPVGTDRPGDDGMCICILLPE